MANENTAAASDYTPPKPLVWSKASELWEMALEDLADIEKAGGNVRMSDWLQNRRVDPHVRPHEADCSVCLAGALIFYRMDWRVDGKWPIETDPSDVRGGLKVNHAYNRAVLWAIDSLRRGSVGEALLELMYASPTVRGLADTGAEIRAIGDAHNRRMPIYYPLHNPLHGEWWDAARKLLDDLKAAGL